MEAKGKLNNNLIKGINYSSLEKIPTRTLQQN